MQVVLFHSNLEHFLTRAKAETKDDLSWTNHVESKEKITEEWITKCLI